MENNTGNIDERLLRLSQENPVVYHYLKQYMQGGFSLEQVLTECILTLAETNASQSRMLEEFISHSPQPTITERIKPKD